MTEKDEEDSMGPLDRFTNSLTLHAVIYVLESLQTQINSTASGALPSNLLGNVH